MSAFYDAVAEHADHRCEYCHAPEIVFNIGFEVEHITPESRQGTSDSDNLALACRACSLFKSNIQQGRDEETETTVPLFHPRRDVWDEHFQVAPGTAEIIGLTPTGRVTVARLQMNRPRQITARQRWIQLELFP